jgi:hypothetical protein
MTTNHRLIEDEKCRITIVKHLKDFNPPTITVDELIATGVSSDYVSQCISHTWDLENPLRGYSYNPIKNLYAKNDLVKHIIVDEIGNSFKVDLDTIRDIAMQPFKEYQVSMSAKEYLNLRNDADNRTIKNPDEFVHWFLNSERK